jgi:hypothetical protein
MISCLDPEDESKTGRMSYDVDLGTIMCTL